MLHNEHDHESGGKTYPTCKWRTSINSSITKDEVENGKLTVAVHQDTSLGTDSVVYKFLGATNASVLRWRASVVQSRAPREQANEVLFFIVLYI